MKNFFLNDEMVIGFLRDDKIVVVDGGARGGLFKPFNLVNSSIVKVIRFEPDEDAIIEDQSENDLIIRKALWKNSDTIPINIAIQESTSSVYPFNRNLQKFIDPYVDVRKTKKTVNVNATSLDDLITTNQIPNIDFIKLDIHGAEYEVLEGSLKALNHTIGLLIESWIIPIHLGQKLRCSVELLAYTKDFYVFEEYNRSDWGRLNKKFTKRQPISKDTLFFKDPIIDKNIKTPEQAIKLIGISELFGHIAYAWQLAQFFYENNVINKKWYDKIISHLNRHARPTLKEKLFNKLESFSSQLFNTCSYK